MSWSEPSATRDLPLTQRVELVHGYAQIVANELGVDLVHVKGAAVDPQLRRGRRLSVDVDVLVRPEHVETFVTGLRARGWQMMTSFEEGSAFGHAMNLRHDLGMIDLHRRWPGFGIDPETAFDILWERRTHVELAHVTCAVPDLAVQRLVLLLHYGRSGGQRVGDRNLSWTYADADARAQVEALVETFDAHLAFAAATGHLEEFHDERGYRLWKYFARGEGGRVEEWSARWAAASGLRAKADVLVRFVRVNPDLLRLDLGREPTRRDYLRAQLTRGWTALVDVAELAVRAGKRLRRPRGMS